MKEEWRDTHVGLGYQVSSYGRLRSRWVKGGCPPVPRLGTTWTILKGSKHRLGYTQVYIRCKHRLERWWVHRLVAWAFLGPPPFPKAEVRHLNGDPQNNTYTNLAWGTHNENQKDIIRHGTAQCGENNKGTTLTNAQVLEIVRLKRVGVIQNRLAKMFGVSPMTISRIINGKTWTTVTGVTPR